MSGPVPVVETERLLLREWREEDLDAFARIAADPEVMRWFPGPMTRAEAWRSMALHIGHWMLRGFGNWSVELKASGTHIGRLGLWQPEGWPGLEVGWFLAREAWGQGFATEGARATLEFAWSELGASEVVSVIRPENAASEAVAARLGMQPEEPFEHAGFAHRVWRLRAPERHEADTTS